MAESPPEPIADLLPAEPVAVRLMNTVWADRAGLHDDLGSVAQLGEWVQRCGLADRSDPGPDDLAAFWRLRAAARRIAAHLTGDERPASAAGQPDLETALADLNADVTTCAPALVAHGSGFAIRWHPGPDAALRARAELALDVARLFAGEDAARLRACGGPGCVLYYLQDHPRRGWCSAGCGNRARVARHYDRHRRSPDR